MTAIDTVEESVVDTPVERGSIRTIARGGAIAGIIKLASAGLSFLMFVMIALLIMFQPSHENCYENFL